MFFETMQPARGLTECAAHRIRIRLRKTRMPEKNVGWIQGVLCTDRLEFPYSDVFTRSVALDLTTHHELKNLASSFPKATCYLVEIISKGSKNKEWKISAKGTILSNSRVRKISADRFYAIVTGKKTAFKELCDALPIAISDYIKKNEKSTSLGINGDSKAFETIEELTAKNLITIIEQIFNTSLSDYNSFYTSVHKLSGKA
jgi:hypothetical protein